MRDPRSRVDCSLLDEPDNPGKVGRESVAAAANRQLSAVHHSSVWKRDVALRDAHINKPAAESAKFQRARHARMAPRCIDDNIAKPAIGESRDRLSIRRVALGQHAVGHPHRLADKL